MTTKWLQRMLRTKAIGNTMSTEVDCLKKCLGLTDLICYGVGCSVGAGVYSLIGVGAAVAGPAISLSFLFSGLACIFTSLTYSEFAARIPVTGSAYTFVYVSFGEFAAWLVGWNLTLGYGISAAGVARSWASYAYAALGHLGLAPPPALAHFEWLGQSCSILAPVLVLLCTIVLLRGAKESSKFNAVITVLNVSVLLAAVVAGSFAVDQSNWTPFFQHGVSGTASGAGVIFFAYLGFDMVSCLAEEVKDPQRMLPIGIVGSLLISISIYFAVSLVVTGMAPADVLGPEVPLINAFQYAHVQWIAPVISTGSILGLTTSAFTCLMGQPRIFYRMAKDGLLPAFFATVDEKTQVPSGSTLASGVLISFISFFFELEFLANVISCGTLLVFTFVNAGVLALRLKCEDCDTHPVIWIASFVISTLGISLSLKWESGLIATCFFGIGFIGTLSRILNMRVLSITTFSCPCLPLVPCAGIFINIVMMANLPSFAWIGVGVWMLIGLTIYFGYGIRHSVLHQESELTPLIHKSS